MEDKGQIYNNMEKKILYIMNVDWNWIKQRPHFIAEKMIEKGNDIYILFQHHYSRGNYQHREFDKKFVEECYFIPRIDRYKWLRWLNDFLKKNKITKTIKKIKPEYIYLTRPQQINYISNKYNGTIIYDCMDNHKSFETNSYFYDYVVKCERNLCERADIVFTSSLYLKTELGKCYGSEIEKKTAVVFNGFDGKIANPIINEKKGRNFKLCYLGTISNWFDFDIIEESLSEFDNIEYHLFGPLDNVVLPQSDRIIYHGTVEHDKIYEVTKDMDVFIMTFKINELILAVDPVKLYEYINFNRNIICVGYPEVRRYEKFVHLYYSSNEYIECIRRLILNNSLMYSGEERYEFLNENTWEKRVSLIEKCLRK